MGGPWEDFVAPQQSSGGPWEDFAQTKDAIASPPPNPDFEIAGHSSPVQGTAPGYLPQGQPVERTLGVNPYDAILTNKPVGGIANNFLRSLPAAAGGVLGGAAGGASGLAAGPFAVAASPAAAIAGAGLGGAAGESLRQGLVNSLAVATGDQPTTPSRVLANVAIQGGANAATEGVAQGVQALKPFAKKAFAGAMRVGPNIKTEVGEAILNDPNILNRALSPEQMSQRYASFEEANGLVSPRNARAVEGNLIFKPGEAEDIVNSVYQKLVDPAVPAALKPNPQEVYEASQAARFLRDQAKFANPNQAANLSNINEAKRLIDSTLESYTANSGQSYAALRQANFESKVAQQFKSPYPQNLNGQPNVLRTIAAARSGLEAGAAAGALHAGLPGAIVGGVAGGALGPIAVSPMAYGAAIRAADFSAPVIKAATQGVRFAPGSIAAYYSSPGAATP